MEFITDLFVTNNIITDLIADGIQHFLEFILLWLNDKVFSIAGGLYNIFFVFTNLNILDGESGIGGLTSIIDRIQLLVGLLMLFKVAFSFLTYLVSPNKLSDEGVGAAAVVRNLVIVVIMLVSVDFFFLQLGNLQTALLNEATVNNIIMGRGTVSAEDMKEENITLGEQMTYTAWISYFSVINEGGTADNPDYSESESCYSADDTSCENARAAVAKSVLGGNANAEFNELAGDDNLKTNSLLSIIGGIVLCILLISFIIDIGIRAFKLAFLQMIAPIPIISYIEPKTQKSFWNWLKMTLLTFADLFIRITILLLATVFISYIPSILDSDAFSSLSGISWGVAYFLLFLAIYGFAKMVPSLLQDIFGIDMKNSSLNPFSRAGFGAITGGLIGSVAGAAAGGIIGAKAGGLGGALSGMFMGGVRGGASGATAKNPKGYFTGAKTGIERQAAAAKKRYEEGKLRDRVKKKVGETLNAGRVAVADKRHAVTKSMAEKAAAVKQRAEKLAKKNLQGNLGGRRFSGRDGYISARTENQQESLRAARERMAQYDANKLRRATENAEQMDRLQHSFNEQFASLTPEQQEIFRSGNYEGASKYENSIDYNNAYMTDSDSVDATYSDLQSIREEMAALQQEAADNGYENYLSEYEASRKSVEDSNAALVEAENAAGNEYDNAINDVVQGIKENGATTDSDGDTRFISDTLSEIESQNNTLDKEFQVNTSGSISDIEKQAKEKTEEIERSPYFKGGK